MKVLVVEDAAISRHLLRKYIKNTGHEIIAEAEDGIEGLNIYKKLNPDLVILDIRMPNMTGIEFLKAIKEYDENAKVLICSAIEDRSIIIEAKKLGAIDYITKPFEEEDLIKKLKKIENKF